MADYLVYLKQLKKRKCIAARFLAKVKSKTGVGAKLDSRYDKTAKREGTFQQHCTGAHTAERAADF